MGLRDFFYPTHIKASGPGFSFDVDISRFAHNLDAAQRWLVMQVAADCLNFIPFQNGTLRSSLTHPDEKTIEWNTPYAHYQYMGEVYVNPKTGKSGYQDKDGIWHGWRGAKVPSGRPITYHTAGTGDHWFEKAAHSYGDEWIRGVKRIAWRGR